MNYFLPLLALMAGFCHGQNPSASAAATAMRQHQLLFIENKGQVADAQGNPQPGVLFTAGNNGARVWLTANAIHYQFSKTGSRPLQGTHDKMDMQDITHRLRPEVPEQQATHHFSIVLKGSNTTPQVVTEGISNYTENYYLPQCPDGILGVKAYEKITYKEVYPGIDWVLYSKGGFMEYDFIIHAGSNPSQIQLEIRDADSTSLTQKGSLEITTPLGRVTQKQPVSYTETGTAIATHFIRNDNGTLGFSGNFPKGATFRIDPEIVWATYYGGSSENDGRACATDGSGNVYLAGHTHSNSAIAINGFQDSLSGVGDAFLAKFDSNGNPLWATYYGGSDFELGYSCAVDKNDNIYLAGTTASTDVIAHNGTQQNMGGQFDSFIVKFNSAGSRIWGTYCGGTEADTGVSCTTDNGGNVLLAGTTESTQGIAYNGFQSGYSGNIDSFGAKYLPDGHLLWASYYGGTNLDIVANCVTDSAGSVYLAGITESNGLSYSGFQNNFAGGQSDVFLVKFDYMGIRLWATYYGGDASDSGSCAVDANDNIYILGSSSSYSGIATSGAFKTAPEGQSDTFIAKFDGRGGRLWGTYFGGSGFESATGTIDSSGAIYLTGLTTSSSGIAQGGFQDAYTGGPYDFYVAKFTGEGFPIWSSYYGGPDNENTITCATGPDGALYLAGITSSASGIAAGGFDTTYGGGNFDAFLAKIDTQSLGTNTPVPAKPFIRCYPNPVIDVLTIAAPQAITGVKVYTLTGQLVIEKPGEGLTTLIAMQQLQTGSYIVTVNCGNFATSFLIVKAGK